MALIEAEVNSRLAIERAEILVELDSLKARSTKSASEVIRLVELLVQSRGQIKSTDIVSGRNT